MSGTPDITISLVNTNNRELLLGCLARSAGLGAAFLNGAGRIPSACPKASAQTSSASAQKVARWVMMRLGSGRRGRSFCERLSPVIVACERDWSREVGWGEVRRIGKMHRFHQG